MSPEERKALQDIRDKAQRVIAGASNLTTMHDLFASADDAVRHAQEIIGHCDLLLQTNGPHALAGARVTCPNCKRTVTVLPSGRLCVHACSATLGRCAGSNTPAEQ